MDLSPLSLSEVNQMINSNLRIVSFSLYGKNRKFTYGAIENAKYVANHMPGWVALFYVGDDVDRHVVLKLTELGAIIKIQESDWHKNGMFWRFKVFRDFLPEYAIIRDSDSRITARELCAVEEWIASGKTLHIMRDHPYHNVRIPGGMWGGTRKLADLIPIEADLAKYSTARGQDQVFLGEYIYPLVRKSLCVHDSFFLINLKRQKFSIQRIENEFIGESIEYDESFNPNLRQLISVYSKSFRLQILLNLRYFREHSIMVSKVSSRCNKIKC
jgi:hypothetical protein